MCGIVGVFDHGRVEGGASEALLVRMRETLHHRGPDGEGLFVSPDGRVGFGHRRLSIVDLEGGAQPMFGDGGTVLVFNGEIYNYPDLRRRLEADGARFRTRCDTEVILHLYARHGEDLVEHLNGMFAFALWDPAREVLVFARDHVGEKPFYWSDRDGSFVFGSEIKALLEHPTVTREVNRAAIAPYLANLVTPGPDTLYEGVSKLPPGCVGRRDRDGLSIRRYWSPYEPRRFTGDGEEALERIRAMLDASVRMRLMSDVPVGVLLSGGVDSTAIVALLREQARELSSFTVGYEGYDRVDERAEARWVAERFGTAHHEVVMTEADALATLAPMVHHQDEPLADPVCVPLNAVCRLARENGVKVVLAGEGADELFWGYQGYQSVVERWRRFRTLLALPRPLVRAAASITSPQRAARREQLEGVASGRVNPIHFPVGMTRHQREHLLRDLADDPGWAPSEREPHEDALTTLGFDTQEYEFQVRLPELLLMRIDRFSMAHSVEARVPFLDPNLVDFVYRLPLDLKVSHGSAKYALKRAIADVLPSRVADRPKQGFAAPTSEWFGERHGGLLRRLMAQDALREHFDVDYLDRMLSGADHTTWHVGQILWPILNFGLWHKYWIENESIDELVGAGSHGEPLATAA